MRIYVYSRSCGGKIRSHYLIENILVAHAQVSEVHRTVNYHKSVVAVGHNSTPYRHAIRGHSSDKAVRSQLSIHEG